MGPVISNILANVRCTDLNIATTNRYYGKPKILLTKDVLQAINKGAQNVLTCICLTLQMENVPSLSSKIYKKKPYIQLT